MSTDINTKAPETVIPTSAPASLRQMTPEQRQEWYKEMRAKMSRSRIALRHGHPDKKYYWARKDDTNEMSRLEWMGYEVVRKTTQPKAFDCSGLREDGTYVLGDVILMQIDIDISEFLDEENARVSREMISGAQADFKSDAAKEGVPTFERDEANKVIATHK